MRSYYTHLRLEDAALADDPFHLPHLHLDRENGFVPQSLNIGFPDIREQMFLRPNRRGSFDDTGLTGSRAVQLTLAIAEELTEDQHDYELEQILRRWMHPRKRVYLCYKPHTSAIERRLFLRPAPSERRSISFIVNEFGEFQLAWKDPRGYVESCEPVEGDVIPWGTETGRTYNLVYPRVYPFMESFGNKIFNNLGDDLASPKIVIYGPCVGPRIENQTTGQKIVFKDGYVLSAGQYIEIDMEEETVLLNGDPESDAYSQLKTPDSEWFSFLPGENQVRYFPIGFSIPSRIRVTFRHTWS